MINAQAKDPGLQKCQDIFRRHPGRIFQWAENRSVPAEDNMSERGVRRTVIARKVCLCDGPEHLHPRLALPVADTHGRTQSATGGDPSRLEKRGEAADAFQTMGRP